MCKNEVFRQNAAIFHSSTNKEEIITGDGNAMRILYDGAREINLNRLRFHKFVSKTMSSSSVIQVQSIPPTSDAAAQHSIPSYFQTQTWIGNDKLDPTEWG